MVVAYISQKEDSEAIILSPSNVKITGKNSVTTSGLV